MHSSKIDTWRAGGLLSYTDGSSWDFERDYLVVFAQSDDFCNPPVPYKPGSEIKLCCAPEKGGCSCNVGCEIARHCLALTASTIFVSEKKHRRDL